MNNKLIIQRAKELNEPKINRLIENMEKAKAQRKPINKMMNVIKHKTLLLLNDASCT